MPWGFWISNFSIFNLGEKKNHYKVCNGSQFNQQCRENSPETSKNYLEQDTFSRYIYKLAGSLGNHLRKKNEFELATENISRGNSGFASLTNKMLKIKEVVI